MRRRECPAVSSLRARRGILLTPFHDMALMCPDTTEQDVDAHTELFAAALAELLG
ncbi:hypothetical protein AB0A91_29745 [Streptomyces sp. NPDC042207]|uniref:hypothetical protein n=1 Tax=Streptomyces sp. NPDC042207 TaxID=3154331 RepID=UPI0033D90281